MTVTAATVEQLTPDGSARKGRPGLPSGGVLPRLQILYSYYYLRTPKPGVLDLLTALAPYVDLLIDSGAFSDFHMKRKAEAVAQAHSSLNIDDYIAWLADTKHLWWQYIALDVVRKPEASRANLRRMVAAGLAPMPVFVYPESMDAIPDMMQINEYLCVAGGRDASKAYMHQRFRQVYEASEARAKIHGLAFVKWPDLYQLPIHSVDSSSWTRGKRYGHLVRFDARGGPLGGPWTCMLVKEKNRDMIVHLRRCNVTPEILATRRKPHWDTNDGIAAAVTTNAYLQFFADAAARQRRLFLAVANQGQVLEIISVAAAGIGNGYFDYQLALSLVHTLKRMWKSKDKSEAIGLAVHLVKEKTRWQEPI